MIQPAENLAGGVHLALIAGMDVVYAAVQHADGTDSPYKGKKRRLQILVYPLDPPVEYGILDFYPATGFFNQIPFFER